VFAGRIDEEIRGNANHASLTQSDREGSRKHRFSELSNTLITAQQQQQQ
jgi:hypothetical protein